jgi:glutathione S-transferase
MLSIGVPVWLLLVPAAFLLRRPGAGASVAAAGAGATSGEVRLSGRNPANRRGMMTLKVHNFAGGARGLRVMWLCEEMGLAYNVQLHEYPVSPAYRALNPLGTLPFLEDGGVALNESIAIMLYLAHSYGPTPLLPLSDQARAARCLQLTLFGETELGMNLNPLLAAQFMAGAADKQNWSVTGLKKRVGHAVAYAAALIGEAPYLVGEALSLADISVGCGLAIWTGALGGELPPALAGYQERVRSRPAYQRAKQRCQGPSS